MIGRNINKNIRGWLFAFVTAVSCGLLLVGTVGATNVILSRWDSSPGRTADRTEAVTEIVVKGTVKALPDSTPVRGATVEFYRLFGDNTLGTTTTEAEGTYQLRFSLPDDVDLPNRFRIEAVADGFARKRAVVGVDSSVVESADLTLEKTVPEQEPISISSLEDLQKIGTTPEYPLHGTYVLTQDLDAAPTAQWNEGRGFDPIGQNAAENSKDQFFEGTFDGKGHTISNLTIDRPEATGIGLFAGIAGGTVKNLTLRSASVTGEKTVGGLAGTSHSFTAIENCRVEGTVAGWYEVGGLTGLAIYTDIRGSEVHGSVGPSTEEEPEQKYTGSYSPATGGLMGGLAGVASNSLIEASRTVVEVAPGYILESVGGIAGASSSEIRHSRASGSLELDMGNERTYNAIAVGGLVGENSGRIYASSAAVPVQGHTVGGLVGNNERATVEESFASGSVYTPNGVAGGLVGMNIGGAVRSSYATGKVSGEKNVGGLMGQSRAGGIKSSFAIGDVSAETSETAGGLLGNNWGGTTLNASYWNRETTGQEDAVGDGRHSSTESQSIPARGLRRNEMTGEQARRYMKGLDFDTVWQTVPGDHPTLRVETRDPDGDH